MRQLPLLLDQMLDEAVAGALHEIGHDVVRVSEIGLACASDAEILKRAVADGLLIITLDEHFGDWAVLELSSHPGVIRVKADPTTTNCVLAALLPFLLKSVDRDSRDQLVIVRASGVRWVQTHTAAEQIAEPNGPTHRKAHWSRRHGPKRVRRTHPIAGPKRVRCARVP